MNRKKLTIEDYMQMPWHYCTEASEWEGKKGFWISVSELPDCSIFASNIESGLATIAGLLREYLLVAISSDAKIPLPEQQLDKQYSGKLLLRVPVSLHMGLKNAAKQEKTSLNQFAVHALTEAVTRLSRPGNYSNARQRTAKKLVQYDVLDDKLVGESKSSYASRKRMSSVPKNK